MARDMGLDTEFACPVSVDSARNCTVHWSSWGGAAMTTLPSMVPALVSAAACRNVSVCCEQDPDPVVGEVPEPVGQGAGLLDDTVDRPAAAVGDTTGGEVGQDLGSPLPQGPTESDDSLMGQVCRASSQLLGQLTARGGGRVGYPADLFEIDQASSTSPWVAGRTGLGPADPPGMAQRGPRPLPIQASWLSHIEIYLSTVQPKVIKPAHFADLTDLERGESPHPGPHLTAAPRIPSAKQHHGETLQWALHQGLTPERLIERSTSSSSRTAARRAASRVARTASISSRGVGELRRPSE